MEKVIEKIMQTKDGKEFLNSATTKTIAKEALRMTNEKTLPFLPKQMKAQKFTDQKLVKELKERVPTLHKILWTTVVPQDKATRIAKGTDVDRSTPAISTAVSVRLKS